MKNLTLIGRVERVDFPQLSLKRIPAKIDTGADASSIWASSVVVEDEVLKVVLFGAGSAHYTGDVLAFEKGAYEVTRVANSFGHREFRYKIKMALSVKGRTIRGSFTLSDRSNKMYPILIGRSLLNRKFIVDVSRGSPLRYAERIRKKMLQKELIKRNLK